MALKHSVCALSRGTLALLKCIGIGRVWNGVLYLTYGSSSKINTPQWCKTSLKTRSYFYVTIAPEFYYFSSQSRISNTKISILLFYFISPSLFFLSFLFSFPQHIYDGYERSRQQTNSPLSDIFLISVRAAWELRSTSNGPHTLIAVFVLHAQIEN